MDNQKQNFEDFLLDESFIKWVKDPDYELNIYWEQWIKHNQHRRHDVILAREFILRMRFNTTLPTDETTKKVFNDIIAKLENDGNNSRYQGGGGLSSRHSTYYLKIAAFFLILIISAGSIYWIYQRDQLYRLEKSKVLLITKSNPSSIRSQIKLPDGTKVWLNAASEISFPEKFGDVRKVKLKGEAYFEVVEDPDTPFVVQTQLSFVKVLGTSFNVKAHEEDKEDYISLVTGKVKILRRKEEDKFFLLPGEQLVIKSGSNSVKTRPFDKRNVTGWTEGWLTFKDANANEIIHKLERWYNVKITLLNAPSEQWNVTGYFRNQSLELVLDRLSFSKNFKYEINDRNVTIIF